MTSKRPSPGGSWRDVAIRVRTKETSVQEMDAYPFSEETSVQEMDAYNVEKWTLEQFPDAQKKFPVN
jgi:hypothetical protein